MATTSAQFTLNTSTATVLVAGDYLAEEVHIHSGSGTIYIGGDSTVTSSTGYRMDNGDKQVFRNHEGPLYAIAGTGTPIVYVLSVSM